MTSQRPPSASGAPDGKRARLGLRMRLLLILVPVLVVLFALDSWSDTDTLGQELQKAYDQTLLEPAQALADSVEWNDERGEITLTDAFHIASMFEAVSARAKFLRVEAESADGKQAQLIMGPSLFPEPPPSETRPAIAFRDAGEGARVFYTTTYHGHPIRVAALQRVVHDNEGNPWTVLIQAARSTYAIDRAQHDLMTQAFYKDARTLAILVLIVWLGIGWGLQPLQALRRAIHARKAEDLTPLRTASVPPEVRPLVDAMNLHLGQQRDTLEAQRQFLADASHQLRTPLAIMHTQTGYALRESDPEAVRTTLHGILQQLQRSRRVCEQLLSLAQIPQHEEAPEAISDANAVAREVVIACLPLALERQIDLGWLDARGDDADEDEDTPGAPPAAPVHASALSLHEVLANLVHNAVSYTQRGGRVNVSVHVLSEHGLVRILVQDDGPGIAPEMREQAFVRFSRLQQESSVQGSGLGLAIARAYVQQMRGSIALLDGEGGKGLTVRVELPLAATPHQGISRPAI